MRRFAVVLSMASFAACAQDARPQTPQAGREWHDVVGDGPQHVPSDFVRFVQVGDGGHLDTAITTYTKDGVEVVFYGAVHIADPACYATLNDRFTTCDALLYELVGPENYRPTRDREQRGFNPVAFLQNALKTGLELAFQLDEIDYQAANFVHADMTPQEFERSMAERGESLLSIMWSMMVSGMKMQREQADAAEEAGEGGAAARPAAPDLVKAFQSGEGRHVMRMTFAEQLEQLEQLAAGGEGSTLLEGRNEKCLEVLQRELKKGHKRIGIYYGAAHLPDLERHVVDDLGFAKTGQEWLVAWDCAKRPDKKIDRELLQLRRQCRQELQVLAAAARDQRRDAPIAPPPTARDLAAIQRNGQPAYAGPLVDPWGHDYLLEKRATGSRWQVVSLGPDGVHGTADDLVEVEPRRGGLVR